MLKKKLQTSQDIGVAKAVQYDKCAVSRLNDICTAVNEALSASTKLISSSPKRPKLPQAIIEIQTKIKDIEKQRLGLLKECSFSPPKNKERNKVPTSGKSTDVPRGQQYIEQKNSENH